jgi:hypothetical protein
MPIEVGDIASLIALFYTQSHCLYHGSAFESVDCVSELLLADVVTRETLSCILHAYCHWGEHVARYTVHLCSTERACCSLHNSFMFNAHPREQFARVSNYSANPFLQPLPSNSTSTMSVQNLINELGVMEGLIEAQVAAGMPLADAQSATHASFRAQLGQSSLHADGKKALTMAVASSTFWTAGQRQDLAGVAMTAGASARCRRPLQRALRFENLITQQAWSHMRSSTATRSSRMNLIAMQAHVLGLTNPCEKTLYRTLWLTVSHAIHMPMYGCLHTCYYRTFHSAHGARWERHKLLTSLVCCRLLRFTNTMRS